MAPVDAAERLINLIIALQHAPGRMTRQEIRETVHGYDRIPAGLDDAEARRKEAAFERMFERDKDALRAMGIPLETVTDPTHGDDIGYRIAIDTAQLPPLELTPSEVAVIHVASTMWQDATMRSDAQHAVTKISATSTVGPGQGLPLGGRQSGQHRTWVALLDALTARQTVSFDYASSRSGLARRTVQPWKLALKGSAAYVWGMDVDKNELRTFRVNRIHGSVARVGTPEAYTIPDDAVFTWEESFQPGTARLGLRPEAGHDLRARGTLLESSGGWDIFEVPYAHPSHVHEAVLALGGSARVLSPTEIAQSVRESAARALEACDG